MANTSKRQGSKPSTAQKGSDRLATYRAKRRFGVTPEPAPQDGSSQAEGRKEKKTAVRRATKSAGASASAARPPARTPALPAAPSVREGTRKAFVVQKHDARRLHYDVRLEIEGAMASWAVPKGPSYDPAVRRLAVQTEDHPMEYNAFEGRIPEGEYGAGDVLIWDRGTYETVPPGQERAMLDKGHLHVRFFGDKLVGDWHVIRTGRPPGDDGAGGSGKAQWLLFKAKDAHANPAYDVIAERPESIVSGRLATRGPRRTGASEHGKSARALLQTMGEPMLATAVTSIRDAAHWLFEVKYDGYRVFAGKAGSDVRIYTRRANDWTDRFRPIAEGVAKLAARECVVDGEACVLDESGRPSFGALQEWLGGSPRRALISYVVFDLLWLDGRDLRQEPIEARRELLEKLLEGSKGATGVLSYSREVRGDLEELLEAAKRTGLEGLVAKRKGSRYVGGRSGQWLKLRFARRQDCAIVGWVPMAGTKDEVGALLLAVAEQGKLVFAGRVGTGFDTRTRRDLARRLLADEAEGPEVEGAPRIKGAHWVHPKLCCECGFAEWTRDGSMRAPRFLGLREDKTPLECVREAAGGDPAADDAPHRFSAADGDSPSAADDEPASAADDKPAAAPPPPRRNGPKLANPTKVLFPKDGITKQDIWDYYTAIAPVMLPHLAGRPLTLQRYPDGIEGEEWYQQNAPEKSPAFVRMVEVGPRHENKKRIVCDNLDTLQWLANLAALTVHQWCCHVPGSVTTRAGIDHALALPDYVVLDLDPGDGPWDHLIEVAEAVRALLEALELESFVKTSGKRGLHVLVPIAAGPTHEQATGFAEQVARAVAKVLPGVATVERMKDKRSGKLYVDYGQNGEGRTIVAPYTIRARDGAVVSTPIAWSEVTRTLDPARFTIRAVLERVDKMGDLFAGVIKSEQLLP
jgi:bifunctional non-homologous end joining protein LigD